MCQAVSLALILLTVTANPHPLLKRHNVRVERLSENLAIHQEFELIRSSTVVRPLLVTMSQLFG
jgi:hypothetical protein